MGPSLCQWSKPPSSGATKSTATSTGIFTHESCTHLKTQGYVYLVSFSRSVVLLLNKKKSCYVLILFVCNLLAQKYKIYLPRKNVLSEPRQACYANVTVTRWWFVVCRLGKKGRYETAMCDVCTNKSLCVLFISTILHIFCLCSHRRVKNMFVFLCMLIRYLYSVCLRGYNYASMCSAANPVWT